MMAASQSGRSTRRQQGNSPQQEASPSKRATRSGSSIAQSTTTPRRSARTGTQPRDSSKDVVINPALPEIQPRQSYAYGASKTPQLPEQLFARGTMSMQQVTDHMNSDINQAQLNLAKKKEEVQKSQPIQPTSSYNHGGADAEPEGSRAQGTAQGRQESGPRQITPTSQRTEVQRQRRTAAWASSLDESQLDDISEESNPLDTPETKRTEPSSFPSGIFDHSYAYERGLRAPRTEQRPSAIRTFIAKAWEGLERYIETIMTLGDALEHGFVRWLMNLANTAVKVLFELPKSSMVVILLKTFYMVCLSFIMSMGLCFVYRNNICNPSSTSSISQTLQSLCGQCNVQPSTWNFTTGDPSHIHKLVAALNNINSRINTLESHFNSRIDSDRASNRIEMDSLRRQQSEVIGLLQNMGHNTESEIASPLIPSINFFTPANGAIINPWYTSPTRSRVKSLPIRVALSMFGIKRYDANGPATALQPWQDVGDCWCASASSAGHDSIRLGVEVKQLIYPTELVIEHPPMGSTLSPDTAPREIELWADVSHLSTLEYKQLNIESMRMDGSGVKDPISARRDTKFARFASIEYDTSRSSHHVQRFRLDINRIDNLMYSSQLFVVRAISNHGADHSCLYRIRLHGIPVEENEHETKFSREWVEEESNFESHDR